MSVLHAATKKTTPPGNIDRLQAELRSELPGATAVSLPEQVGGDHYLGPCQPWDLIKAMKSSGNLFADYARATGIAYLFRIKGTHAEQLDDLRKCAHTILEAVKHLEQESCDPSPHCCCSS